MNKQFNKWSVHEFNVVTDCDLLPTDTFAEAIDRIDEAEVNYFYVSLNPNDVLEAIENEREIADQLGLRLVFIDEIGIYIAFY